MREVGTIDLTAGTVGGTPSLRPEISRLDASVAVQFKEQVGAIIAGGEKRLVLDLERITFIDSSGLGALVALLKRVGSEGHLGLVRVQPAVKRLLAMTRLDRVFTIHDPVDQVR